MSKKYIKADDGLNIKDGKIESRIRKKWIPLTPEERVRQIYLDVLLNEYG